MSQESKALLLEVGWILLLSTALAFAYNSISPHGIPLIRTPRQLAWSTGEETLSPSSRAEPVAIGIDEAVRIFREGRAIFLDARYEEEYVQGHIEGALSLPMKLLDDRPDLLSSFPKDALIVTYCSGIECELSTDLGFRLASMGYTNVKVFFAGWLEWQQRQLPIAYGPPTTLR